MFLVTTDLHLTDKPRDAYRFGLFPWLRKQQEEHNVEATFILGDLTEAKDRHSAQLVNQAVDGLCQLLPPVYVDRGNHDYIDPKNPFFKFINRMEGLRLITVPRVIKLSNVSCLVLPHVHAVEEWGPLEDRFGGKVDYVFIHQTVEGAISEAGGHRLSGFPTEPLERLGGVIYSGDIHRPQEVGPVTYVGSPYHVRFGDDFRPRVLLIDPHHSVKELRFGAPSKWHLAIRDIDELAQHKGLRAGDQVKITLELSKEEVTDWSNLRRKITDVCRSKNLQVYGIVLKVKKAAVHRFRLEDEITDTGMVRDPREIVEAFCKSEGLGKAVKAAGIEILEA